ncbi:hypothetical protein [Xenorhabdus koppenhoeferi]|uniref:Uncharacterized protein n=1 Tax=Xenorhabdus koppenhoeferi TaxID=351659 RepID=A0A1I7K8U4_9GAMM|nr:hypothetical protein [Xenorhabdus koppenhoeferi]SFU93821.1 hypothetical protein SAMN05421784_14931 [Xenorhabdus koppenhoeferi]
MRHFGYNPYGAQDEAEERRREENELAYKREVLGWEGLPISAIEFRGDFT